MQFHHQSPTANLRWSKLPSSQFFHALHNSAMLSVAVCYEADVPNENQQDYNFFVKQAAS
jgi:hypothetical protein